MIRREDWHQTASIRWPSGTVKQSILHYSTLQLILFCIRIRSSSFLEDLLENQADLIYNLKLQNAHLREMLFKATQTNSQTSMNNWSFKSDISYILT